MLAVDALLADEGLADNCLGFFDLPTVKRMIGFCFRSSSVKNLPLGRNDMDAGREANVDGELAFAAVRRTSLMTWVTADAKSYA